MWNMFLDVTDDVKGGTRPDHSNAINEKRELYDWIEKRTRIMLARGNWKGEKELYSNVPTTFENEEMFSLGQLYLNANVQCSIFC